MNELQNMLHESVSRLFEDELDWDALTRYEKIEWPESLWGKIKSNLKTNLTMYTAGPFFSKLPTGAQL